ncbi:diacylglycerol/polyprenol kinase family protein [Halorubrum vacuolatum]|uniref:Dolichol kinase n=1 Tax=Halorubrum vacuolatum TaxID=63740 RepID=A0A238VUD5_HALVU|nr:dolichol kinase [Halorubrum vacuolatum]SNR37932.1 Dolichol kinase [Halorubrum vacuolatum]
MSLPGAAWRERVEFERRLVHAGGTLYAVPYLLGWISWQQTGYLLLVGLAIVAILEALRLRGAAGPLDPLYDALVREYEADGIAGYALYQVSMTAVALALAPTLAIPAMWMLSLGDPISGMLGDNGPTEPKRATVWVVMGLVCTAIAAAFTVPAFGTTVGVAVAIAGGTAAAVADGSPPIIRGVAVDDNLTIPPAAGVAMVAVLALLG